MGSAGLYTETTTPERPWISRSSAVIHFRGAYFKSFDDLFDLLDIENTENCLFSDLTLGAWRGHWVAAELCQQLGIDTGAPVQPVITGTDGSQTFDYADTVSVLIDNESKGDVNRMKAFELARDILAAAREQEKQRIIIFLPAAGEALETEDQYLIELLRQGFETGMPELTLVSGKPYNAALPAHWRISWLNNPAFAEKRGFRNLAAAVPGIVTWDKAIHGTEDGTIFRTLKNGSLLVAPDARVADLTDLPDDAPAWLIAYRMMFGIESGKDLLFLQIQAGERFAEGGYNIALRLLDGAKKYAGSSVELASIQAQQQNIRIALMRFREAAQQPLPDKNIPSVFRASLLQSKAWGLVMINSPEEAEACFSEARDLMADYQNSRLFLYLLNISALNKLRLNQHAAALAFEKTIEEQLASQQYPDWHIAYVNNINQARLYKKRDELVLSEAYYHKAFAITYNLRNESDLFYTNFCLAQLHAKKGEHTAALICYFRTAMHWLANPLPEAMAPRVISAVLAGPVSEQHWVVDKICDRLYKLIELAVEAASLADYFKDAFQCRNPPAHVHFSRPEPGHPQAPVFACGASGWGVLVSDQRGNSKYLSEDYQRLGQLTFGMIRTMVPAAVFPSQPTILVDACFGTDIPAQAPELINAMVRHGVTQIYWGKNQRLFTQDELLQMEQHMVVQLSPAIHHIQKFPEGWRIHFRRYRAPYFCPERQIQLLELTDGKRSAGEISVLQDADRPDAVLREIRSMEQNGIIQLIHG